MGPFDILNTLPITNPLDGKFPTNANTPALSPENTFPTTAILDDDQKTNLTAYWEKGKNGYPVFSSQAIKQYSDGPFTFTSKKISLSLQPTEEELSADISNLFWELARNVYSYDKRKKLIEDGKTEYNVELYNFTFPVNVPWKAPKPSPEEKEKEREAKKLKNKESSKKIKDSIINSTEILNAVPGDLQIQGENKLPEILYNLGLSIQSLIIPALEKLITEYILAYANENIDTCPPRNVLETLTLLRNRIVDQLNTIVFNIERIGTSITGITSFLNIIKNTISTVEIASIITSAAAKFLPTTPGAIPAALNDAQTFIRQATFDSLGNSKLAKSQSVISSSSMVLSIISGFILQALSLIDVIDILLKKCSPDLTLNPVSDEVKNISLLQLNAQNTQNDTTYKGFVIEIITVPYTPTVNRFQAVGKNKYGIIMIRGNLSFTSNNQTLINELKLIIDRDNLTGY